MQDSKSEHLALISLLKLSLMSTQSTNERSFQFKRLFFIYFFVFDGGGSTRVEFNIGEV